MCLIQALRMWNTKATPGMMSVSPAISVKSQLAPKVSYQRTTTSTAALATRRNLPNNALAARR